MRRVKYLKQNDRYSCGVVAIINTLKWAGYKVTRRSHFKYLKKYMNTTTHRDKCEHVGVSSSEIKKVLKQYKKIKLQNRNNIDETSIYKTLQNKSKSALILAAHQITSNEKGIGKSAHYFLITRYVPEISSYETVNYYTRESKTIMYYSRQQMKNILALHLDKYPQGWIVTKDKKEN